MTPSFAAGLTARWADPIANALEQTRSDVHMEQTRSDVHRMCDALAEIDGTIFCQPQQGAMRQKRHVTVFFIMGLAFLAWTASSAYDVRMQGRNTGRIFRFVPQKLRNGSTSITAPSEKQTPLYPSRLACRLDSPSSSHSLRVPDFDCLLPSRRCERCRCLARGLHLHHARHHQDFFRPRAQDAISAALGNLGLVVQDINGRGFWVGPRDILL